MKANDLETVDYSLYTFIDDGDVHLVPEVSGLESRGASVDTGGDEGMGDTRVAAVETDAKGEKVEGTVAQAKLAIQNACGCGGLCDKLV